uniref:Ribulose-phosphate 3-epimerase n=1 Tax=uncultured Mycoplasmataceae bacterium TaxID=300027 RepID=A0A6G9HGQ9_9MOLU|nr:ribulose-phosphate 3-epimerase [uncultured Mycoplasmataceae bacterium]
MTKILEPSLLSFDLKNMQSNLSEVKQLGIAQVHYDVMDNKFVPNTAFDTEWLNLLHQNGFDISIHFMVEQPREWIKRFISFKGIKAITFHPEPIDEKETLDILKFIKDNKILAGIALKPDTNISKYQNILSQCDLVTVMGVQPGFGGQKFMPITIDNLKKFNEIKNKLNPKLIIQLDGGVNFDVLKQTYHYVDWFISGSFLMKYNGNKKDIIDYFKNLK